MENKSKRYFWNSNADTHVRAVLVFTFAASPIATVISFLSFAIARGSLPVTRESMSVGIVAMGLVWVCVWAVLFGLMMYSYIHLIESQVINPPAPQPKIIDKTVTRVYHQEGNQTKLKQ